MAKTTARTTRSVKNQPTMVSHVVREEVIPEDYEPIGMWGYFGYEILFSIPVVGWIICISFALMAKNRNLRNFARSQFCFLILGIILVCALAAAGVLAVVFSALGLK